MHRIVLATVDSSRRWWVLAIVVAAQFMFDVDAFIVNVAIPIIAVELRARMYFGPACSASHHLAVVRACAGCIGGVVCTVDCGPCRIPVMDAGRAAT